MTLPIVEHLISSQTSLRHFLRAVAAQDELGSELRALLGGGLIEEAENAFYLIREIEGRLVDPAASKQRTRAIIHSASSDQVLDARTFAASVRDEYAAAFARHRRIAEFLEPIVATGRTLGTVLAFALDILLRQAYVAHMSVRVLAELGHGEDAATIARRMMELAVRASYLSADDKPEDERRARAHDFLGRLWRRLSPELQATIPDYSTTPWSQAEAGLEAAPGRKSPKWWEMFDDIGHRELYASDYADLSSIAHGSPYVAPLHYASDIVPLRDIRWAHAVLSGANRYYLAVAMVWNSEFHLINENDLQDLIQGEVPASKSTP